MFDVRAERFYSSIAFCCVMKNISVVILICLLGLVSGLAANPQVQPLDAINEKGSITVLDSPSFFIFYKDGTFRSGPMGLCGPAIEGTWTISTDRPNPSFIVEGRWFWINGISHRDDFRTMVVDIRAGEFRPTSRSERGVGGHDTAEIFQCHFERSHPKRAPLDTSDFDEITRITR